MSNIYIPQKLKEILENADWVCIATRNHFGDPNASNKFLLKCEEDHIFIVDFEKGKTLDNIRNHPTVALPILDIENLMDYQLFGEVEIIESGLFHDELIEELDERHTRFSTNRIIDGIRRSKRFENNELPEISKVVILKINIKDIVTRGPRIAMERRKL